jgi:hypothetical protein
MVSSIALHGEKDVINAQIKTLENKVFDIYSE